MPRGNPNPVQTEAFKAQQWKRLDDSQEPLGKPIPLRFRKTIDEKLRALPGYSGVIRDAVEYLFQRLDAPDKVTDGTISPPVEPIPEFTGKSETFNLRLPSDLVEVIKSSGVSRSELFKVAIAKELKSRGLL